MIHDMYEMKGTKHTYSLVANENKYQNLAFFSFLGFLVFFFLILSTAFLIHANNGYILPQLVCICPIHIILGGAPYSTATNLFFFFFLINPW